MGDSQGLCDWGNGTRPTQPLPCEIPMCRRSRWVNTMSIALMAPYVRKFSSHEFCSPGVFCFFSFWMRFFPRAARASLFCAGDVGLGDSRPMLMPLAWLQNILIPSIYRWFSQLESSIFKGFSMAMLNNQMVLIDTYWYLLMLTYIYMLTTNNRVRSIIAFSPHTEHVQTEHLATEWWSRWSTYLDYKMLSLNLHAGWKHGLPKAVLLLWNQLTSKQWVPKCVKFFSRNTKKSTKPYKTCATEKGTT